MQPSFQVLSVRKSSNKFDIRASAMQHPQPVLDVHGDPYFMQPQTRRPDQVSHLFVSIILIPAAHILATGFPDIFSVILTPAMLRFLRIPRISFTPATMIFSRACSGFTTDSVFTIRSRLFAYVTSHAESLLQEIPPEYKIHVAVSGYQPGTEVPRSYPGARFQEDN